jgi:RNA polymerase sigma-70 factor, ECF subfamily
VGVVGNERVEAVYRAQHAKLWRSLYAHTGDRDITNDAEAEAFTQALRRGDHIDDVSAWVWKSAFRIANGMLASRRRPLRSVTIDPPTAASIAEFVSMLQQLSDQQRACVVLRYVAGFEPSEIAELLGTTSGTVRVQLHRAHESLRNTLRLDGETT